MVSVEKALEIIESRCSDRIKNNPAVIRLNLENSLHHVLSSDVISPIDMPPFRQSAMDGYAIHFDAGILSYALKGEIKAGSGEIPELKKGEAIRIFTGAAVPPTANGVVQQELIIRERNSISFSAEVKSGMNIRPVGEQIKKGAIALSRGTCINAAAMGYLAGLGISDVDVFSKPKIAVLTTGDELASPGTTLSYGQIYESNSLMLSAALESGHFQKPLLFKVEDNEIRTRELLKLVIDQFDVILVSGGISVGDYDFVKGALEHLGVKEEFYKISQKPGKPLYFGTKANKLIFALPGNPASALTCFYIYVLPALNKISGKKFSGLKTSTAILNTVYKKKAGMAHFLKSKTEGATVSILDSQSSAMLNTFAVANAILYVPAETEELSAGSPVIIYHLD